MSNTDEFALSMTQNEPSCIILENKKSLFNLMQPFSYTCYQELCGLRREKTCLWRFVNNKGADQPVHPRRLISIFGFRFLKSVVSEVVTGGTSIF